MANELKEDTNFSFIEKSFYVIGISKFNKNVYFVHLQNTKSPREMVEMEMSSGFRKKYSVNILVDKMVNNEKTKVSYMELTDLDGYKKYQLLSVENINKKPLEDK
ncbi:hypothetical protein ABLB69_05630 [Xenorhabdus khoisanae]|uniref:hypothetical protein n=1 Tax=Xenorhabdus khoisanae TaxID=880157 RepID=UPI0032B84153